MTIAIAPLTPDLWPDFEALFGKQGACYGCWCTHFRLPPAARRENDRERNKELKYEEICINRSDFDLLRRVRS